MLLDPAELFLRHDWRSTESVCQHEKECWMIAKEKYGMLGLTDGHGSNRAHIFGWTHRHIQSLSQFTELTENINRSRSYSATEKPLIAVFPIVKTSCINWICHLKLASTALHTCERTTWDQFLFAHFLSYTVAPSLCSVPSNPTNNTADAKSEKNMFTTG